MQSQVRSDLLLVKDVEDQILALWRTNERLASYISGPGADIYRAGLLAGLLGMAEAHGLNIPDLREAELEMCNKRAPANPHAMRL